MTQVGKFQFNQNNYFLMACSTELGNKWSQNFDIKWFYCPAAGKKKTAAGQKIFTFNLVFLVAVQ